MNFQVVNDKGNIVMQTDYEECIPKIEELSMIQKAGYKFKLDGKSISPRKIKEIGEKK